MEGLLRYPARVFTRDNQIERLYEGERPVSDRSADAYIKRLCHKIRALTNIHTKFGMLSFVEVFVPIYLLNRKAMEEEMISHARSIGACSSMLTDGPDEAAQWTWEIPVSDACG
jgi:hypothetical protein